MRTARYEAERGPGRLSIFTRLAINCFGDDTAAQLAAAVEAAVERSRGAVLGPEAAAAGSALDLVLLHWLDYKVCGGGAPQQPNQRVHTQVLQCSANN